jgi:uncharacterized protein
VIVQPLCRISACLIRCVIVRVCSGQTPRAYPSAKGGRLHLIALLCERAASAGDAGQADMRGLVVDFGADQALVSAFEEAISDVGRLGVAYSGGVDSATLLALAARCLGRHRVVAVLGVSPSLAQRDRQDAHNTAAFIGVPVVEVATHEGKNPAYRRNGPDRCFHCKDELFSRISDDVVGAQKLDAVAYGENADDVVRPDRPGARAAIRHRVLTPLADAGMDKAAVRRIASALQLPCADKPAAPCLASRIPHFEQVSPQKLAQVEAAEAGLRDMGYHECRVRHHGAVARVEVPETDLDRLMLERRAVVQMVKSAGFEFVAVDLSGIQTGAFTLPLVGVRSA